jgi:hypothetical protein
VVDQPFSLDGLPKALEDAEGSVKYWSDLTRERQEDDDAVIAAEAQERVRCLQGLPAASQLFAQHEFVNRRPLGPTGNGLLSAVLDAHAKHGGVVISPEAIAATMLQGVSRFLFMQDTAEDVTQTDLEVNVLPGPGAGAAFMASELTMGLVERDAAAARLARLVSPLSRVPGYAPVVDIGLLAASKARYGYVVGWYACGIRRVELEGTLEMWAGLARMVEAFRQMPALEGLRVWLTAVAQIVHRLMLFDPAEAESVRFMRRIASFRPPNCSPGYASGWITSLFPFFRGKLRTEFPVDGEGEEMAVGSKGLNDHLRLTAPVRVVPKGPWCVDVEPFDVVLVAGLDVQEEPCGDIFMRRPVPFSGFWAPIDRWA